MHLINDKVKINKIRSVYFKITNTTPSIRLSTEKSILTDIDTNSFSVWTINLPINLKSFKMQNTVHTMYPVEANKYSFGKLYDVSNKNFFDLLDRVSCTKRFLYDSEEKVNLIRVFYLTRNIEGLLWVYKQLLLHDKYQNEFFSSDNRDSLYFSQAPYFKSIIKNLCNKDPSNKEFYDTICKKIDNE